jgi:hypothetical protein
MINLKQKSAIKDLALSGQHSKVAQYMGAMKADKEWRAYFGLKTGAEVQLAKHCLDLLFTKYVLFSVDRRSQREERAVPSC